MRKKGKRGQHECSCAIPQSDWLPPESSPNRHASQLILSEAREGSGPLCIVGREVQLVWYATERDRDRQRRGKLVAVLEFKDCYRQQDPHGDCYHFSAVLMEDVSGEYRQWLGHQQHRGRPFGEHADVLETAIRFSVASPTRTEQAVALEVAGPQPFSIHHPKLDELSSPQLDMMFDVMSFLYQSIPGMEMMSELCGESDSDHRSASAEPPPLMSLLHHAMS